MRVKELVHPRHRHRIRQFVKTNIEADRHRKTEQKTEQRNPPVTVNNPAAIEESEKRKLPLFMEPVFKAKDFDPL